MCIQSTLKVRKGYWRYKDTDLIIECEKKLDSCLGEDQVCKEGYTGVVRIVYQNELEDIFRY